MSEVGGQVGTQAWSAGRVDVWLSPRARAGDSDSLCRRILAQYTGQAPQSLEFTAGSHGKPRLAGSAGEWRFNLSHSGDWYAFAVTRHVDIGVDIELTRSDRDTLRLARRFFHDTEVADLEALPSGQSTEYFYDLWTLKEAQVKARGEALPHHLQQRGFRVDYSGPQPQPGRIEALVEGGSGEAACALFDPLPGFRLALCLLVGPSVPLQPQCYLEQAEGAWAAQQLPVRALS